MLPRKVTFDRVALTLRAIRPSDRDALAAGYEKLSLPSRYMRFHGVPKLTAAHWDYFTRVDGRDHVALVLVTDAGEIVGVARFIRAAGTREAEVAITVADAWQRRGLGRTLVSELVPLARERGIDRLVAFTVADNVAIAKLLLACGAAGGAIEAGEKVFALPTDSAA